MSARTVATVVVLAIPFAMHSALGQRLGTAPRISMVPAIQQLVLGQFQQPTPDPAQQPMLPLPSPGGTQVPIGGSAADKGGVPGLPPTMGLKCYAGQVIGLLAQPALIGVPCTVIAYEVSYPGVVGR